MQSSGRFLRHPVYYKNNAAQGNLMHKADLVSRTDNNTYFKVSKLLTNFDDIFGKLRMQQNSCNQVLTVSVFLPEISCRILHSLKSEDNSRRLNSYEQMV